MPTSPTRAQPITAVLAGFVLVMAFGAIASAYGPAMPAFRREFGLGTAAPGLLLTAHFIGALLATIAFGLLESRVPYRALLVVSGASIAGGALVVAAAPTWPVVLAGAALVGAGAGGLDVGLNTVVSLSFGRRAPALLNILHACYGVGAIAGPVFVSVQDDNGFVLPVLVFGALALVATPFLGAMRDPHAHSQFVPVALAPRRIPATLWWFIGLFVVYVGLETGAGAWESNFLGGQGHSESFGAGATAAFWAAFTAGRFIAAPISLRVAPQKLVTWCLLAAGLALAFTYAAPLAPVAFAVLGLALAPVFPTGIAWLNQRLPHVRGATAVVLGSSTLGGALLPPAIGAVIEGTSTDALPVVLLVAVGLCAVAVGGLRGVRAPAPALVARAD